MPAEDRADDGAWVGLTGRVRTLVYNTELVDEADLPGSVLDLTDPQYEGMLGVAPGNASFQDFVTGLRASSATTRRSSSSRASPPTTRRPTRTTCRSSTPSTGARSPWGWSTTTTGSRRRVDDPDQPSALHFFDDGDLGSMLLVTAASVLDTSDQPEDAQRLVEFLLGEEAQTYFAEETLEYPLAAGVEPVEGLFPLDEIVSARVDLRSSSAPSTARSS